MLCVSVLKWQRQLVLPFSRLLLLLSIVMFMYLMATVYGGFIILIWLICYFFCSFLLGSKYLITQKRTKVYVKRFESPPISCLKHGGRKIVGTVRGSSLDRSSYAWTIGRPCSAISQPPFLFGRAILRILNCRPDSYIDTNQENKKWWQCYEIPKRWNFGCPNWYSN